MSPGAVIAARKPGKAIRQTSNTITVTRLTPNLRTSEILRANEDGN